MFDKNMLRITSKHVSLMFERGREILYEGMWEEELDDEALDEYL